LDQEAANQTQEPSQRNSKRIYIDRENHYFNGERFLLKVEEINSAPIVKLKGNTIELRVRPNASRKKREHILDEWYREQLKESLSNLIKKWENEMSVKVNEFAIRKMKTRWGSCNSRIGRIRLNLELAKKPSECLEYVVVHEMAHLIERGHGGRFIALMDKYLPKWRYLKDVLERPQGRDSI